MEEEAKPTANGYGKRPLWQWIAIYVVIGIVVYAAIYYFVLAKKGSSSNQANPYQSPATQTVTSPTEAAATSPAASQNSVSLTSSGFTPATLTVKAGSTVTWTNNSGETATVNSDPHPTHTNYPPLNLGRFDNGGTLSLTFDKPGTYGYHNHLNPSERGTIIVQ